MTTVLSVRLPDDLNARLASLSKQTRRPRSAYVIEALENQLTQIEFEQRVLEEATAIRAGRVQTVSANEVKKSLDLAG